MLPLTLPARPGAGYHVLCLASHSDDIEIGCGATLLRLVREATIERVTWVVLSGDAGRHADHADAGVRQGG